MPLKNAKNPKHILYIFHVEMKNVYILIKQTVINHRGRITCGVTADGFRVDRVCYHFSARLAACSVWMLKTFVKFLQPSPFPQKIKPAQTQNFYTFSKSRTSPSPRIWCVSGQHWLLQSVRRQILNVLTTNDPRKCIVTTPCFSGLNLKFNP